MHISFNKLKEYNLNPSDNEVRAHLEKSEVDRKVFEGIQITNQIAQDKGISYEVLIEQSKASVKKRINLNKNASKPPIKKWIVAASIATLVSIISFLTFQQASQQNSSIILAEVKDSHYRAPDLLRASVSDDQWNKFTNLYQASNFKEALNTIPNSTQAKFYFYKGLCYLYLENPDFLQAQKMFEQLIETPNRYQDQAKWYLAATYLFQDKPLRAKTLLTDIAGNPNHYKNSDAIQLLESRLIPSNHK